MSDYCGFGDWPPCSELAVTGGDAGALIVLGMIALVLVGSGVAAWVRGRS